MNPTDPFDPDAELPEDRDRRSLGISDFLKKTLENTVGSVESAGSVSREALSYVIEQGDKGRKEVLRIFAKEVGDFLKNTDLSEELTKVLTGVQIEFNASVKFKPTGDGRHVKAEVSEPATTVTSVDPPAPADPANEDV